MTSSTTASSGMAHLIDAYDWASGPLGPRPEWPPALRVMVDIALASGFPMLVFWGPGLVQIYNDAFVPILGARHSAALAQPARDCWPEIWDTIGPMLLGVLETGEPVWAEDMPLILERNGYPEQTYFTFSYSRIRDDSGASGLLCTCVETTEAVSREREVRAMAEADGAALRLQYARDHAISLAFQNAALPKTMPTVPGLAFDAMYEAAGEDALVGGDWYDAFRLPDGRVVISVGDVGGSGLEAAVTMGAVRQTIRGAAHVFPEPAAALDAADRALRSEQPDRIVTAFLGILDPLTLALSYASAGHPPPLLHRADGTVIELSATDLPLGLRNERAAGTNHSVVLSENALLVLYTDGLTESTRDVLEGERRLREAIARDDIARSSSPAAAIRHAVVDESNDDVAILTVCVGQGPERMQRWSFRSDDAEVAINVRRELAEMLRREGANEAETADAELVFGELLGNVLRHTGGAVEAALDLTAESPILHVLDRGPGFTYYARLPKDTLSESGRGLYITTMLARDVTVEPRPEGGSHARVVLAARKRRLDPLNAAANAAP